MAKKKQKKSKKSRKEKEPFLSRRIKQKILGVAMALLSVVMALAFFDKAGAGGRGFNVLMDFLVGKTVFALPLIFIIAALMFFSSRFNNKWPVVFSSLILILGISGTLGALSQSHILTSHRAGGWLGHLIVIPIFKGFGIWVSLIFFAGLIVVAGLIVLQFLSPKKREAQTAAEESQFFEPEIDAEKKDSLIKKLFSPKFTIKTIEPKRVEKEKREEAVQEKETDRSEPRLAPPLTDSSSYQPPSLNLLEQDKGLPAPGDIRVNSAIIKRTLQNFDIPVEMSEVNIGPTVTQYTLKPAEGVKLARITALSNDLSLALSAHPIRIEAPIPGKPLLGIEMPNKKRVSVRLRNLFENEAFRSAGFGLWLSLGRDVSGEPLFVDLTKMPHLLIAGATGTGKTICLNSLIVSLLYQHGPELLRFILVDPKRVEFAVYQGLPHLLCPVIFDAAKTVNALKWLIGEMERRFEVLAKAKSRDIVSFNGKGGASAEPLPYIVLVIDELADLMAAKGKEVEVNIVRLAQMARAVGIHLIVATQRPSVEVITGLIKANITSRVSFRVASQVDSRTVLDAAGAEKLLGLGDMLFLSPETKKPKRLQGAYVSEKEVKKVAAFLKPAEKQSEEDADAEISDSEDMIASLPDKGLAGDLGRALEQGASQRILFSEEDPLYQESKAIVIESGRASASLLQRRLRVGYARAARLIDMLEAGGIVGPPEGAKPREVYVDDAEDEGELKKQNSDEI